MSHKFWNNPKLRFYVLVLFVSGFTTYLVMWFIVEPHDKKQRAQQVEAQKRKDKADAVAEYERRQALKAETATAETDANLETDVDFETDFETDADLETDTETFETEVSETVGELETEGAEYYYEAPKNYWAFVYKWTPEQIQASNAPEDVKDWCIQRQALHKREMAYYDKFSANTKASTANSKEEAALLLKSWALLSPEQLEFARQEALKTHSVEDVNNFFSELAQYTNITPEEVRRDHETFLNKREAVKIVRRELAVEWEGILRDRAALEKTKPF